MEAKELIKKQKTYSILRIIGWSALLVMLFIDLFSEKWHRTTCWILIALAAAFLLWSIFGLTRANKDLASLKEDEEGK